MHLFKVNFNSVLYYSGNNRSIVSRAALTSVVQLIDNEFHSVTIVFDWPYLNQKVLSSLLLHWY